MDLPFFADVQLVYPLPLILLYIVVTVVAVFVWEVGFLRSTIFGLKGKQTWAQLTSIFESMEGYVAGLIFDEDGKEGHAKVKSKEARTSMIEAVPWAEDAAFWATIASEAAQPPEPEKAHFEAGSSGRPAPKVDEDLDIVGFTARQYLGSEEDEKATISVVRSGPKRTPVEVTLSVRETSYKTNFKAVKGKEFVELPEVKVKFEPGESLKSFDVKILKGKGGWKPSRYFVAELVSVSSDTVIIGGPSCLQKKMKGGPLARVYIAQASNFPRAHNRFPQTTKGDIQMIWTYFMERKEARGWHWWKTMLSLMYEPFHSTFVIAVVQKFLLDFACDPRGAKFNNYWAIVGAGLALSTSFAVLRWAFQCQTKHRGRTGGCRMKHRVDMFSKLMNLDHEEQLKYQSAHWLYCSLVDVDVLVASGYWQGFVLIQNVFAMCLSVVVLFLAEIYKVIVQDQELQARNFLDVLGIVVLTPIAFFFLWRRERMTSVHLEQRSQLEQYWVENLANLTRNANQIYAIGTRDLMSLETDFETESSTFVKHHQAARDYMADTTWIPKWFSNLTYVLMTMYAGFRLFQANVYRNSDLEEEERFVMTAGDLVLVVKVYAEYSKYLGRVSSSIISMMKAAVAMRRVSGLLDEKEFGQLQMQQSHKKAVNLDTRTERYMLFKKPVMKLRGERLIFRMKDSVATMGIKLGGVCRIDHGTLGENAVLTFLKLAGGVQKPQGGDVVCETPGLVLFMPLSPFEVRHNTVVERLLFTSMPTNVALRAAKALGLDPDRRCSSLTTGEAKLLELFCGLIRDPEVLILDRPLAILTAQQRTRMRNLLRVWQSRGGSQAVINYLTEGLMEPKVVHPLLRQRTLIVTDGDMQEEGDEKYGDNLVVLSEIFEVAEPAEAHDSRLDQPIDSPDLMMKSV